jgi:hypothetical protein
MVDLTAGVVAIGTLISWLPSIAAAFTIVWTALRIYDWIVNKVRESRDRR